LHAIIALKVGLLLPHSLSGATSYRLVISFSLCFLTGFAWEESIRNIIPNGGLNDLLSVWLKSGTQTTTWYILLVDNASFSAFAAADTMSSHSGWIENTDYDESVRQTWTGSAISGQSTDNTASPAVFTISTTITIKGAAFVSNNTKGGTTGILASEAAFDSNRSLVDNQTLSVTITAASASS